MRVVKFSRTLLLLALPLAPAACVLAQEHPNVQPSAVRDQLMKQTSGAPQAPPASPAKVPATPRNSTQAPPVARPQAKPAAPAAAQKPGTKPPVEKRADQKSTGSRRDPFETLLNNTKPSNAPPENLPPGKAGLVVATLRIDGIVHGSAGTIAIVSNPQERVYFLREGDKLYDGSVERITLEAITFHEIGKDAFGKPVEREVIRRLYPSPGEQQ